jgi:hypothetical protein
MANIVEAHILGAEDGAVDAAGPSGSRPNSAGCPYGAAGQYRSLLPLDPAEKIGSPQPNKTMHLTVASGARR